MNYSIENCMMVMMFDYANEREKKIHLQICLFFDFFFNQINNSPSSEERIEIDL